jgi:PhoH-like ATPase
LVRRKGVQRGRCFELIPAGSGAHRTPRRPLGSSHQLTYVLDTSVLLADPAAIRRFDEHEVVLPVVVITELEGKRHHPELGYFARSALRLLDELRVTYGRLDEPLPVGERGGSLRVELNHTDAAVLPAGFRLGDNDTRILPSPTTSPRGATTSRWCPRTCRCGQASAVGWREEYRAELPGSPGGRHGRVEFRAASTRCTTGVVTWRGAATSCHTGWCCSRRGSALGRVADKPCSWCAVTARRSAFAAAPPSSASPRLLLDPTSASSPLGGGRAGTGKSALALCAGSRR